MSIGVLINHTISFLTSPIAVSLALIVLGGGVGANTNTIYYTELYMGADRVAHAARIWKAGKAPVIITSGSGEYNASLPFLKELGVPESAILVENISGNTDVHLQPSPSPKPKILLVTSAWHMPALFSSSAATPPISTSFPPLVTTRPPLAPMASASGRPSSPMPTPSSATATC